VIAVCVVGDRQVQVQVTINQGTTLIYRFDEPVDIDTVWLEPDWLEAFPIFQ
jgi:hypothetical protein